MGIVDWHQSIAVVSGAVLVLFNQGWKFDRVHAVTSPNGKTFNLLCRNHIRNIWIKNVLESLTTFLKTRVKDSLDDIAPEFRASASFVSFVRVLLTA